MKMGQTIQNHSRSKRGSINMGWLPLINCSPPSAGKNCRVLLLLCSSFTKDQDVDELLFPLEN